MSYPETAADFAKDLRSLLARIPADTFPQVREARSKAAAAVESVVAAFGTDPTLAERQQRNLDLLSELLRRIGSLARQTDRELERQRLTASGGDVVHLGLTNRMAPEELQAVSERCPVISTEITDAVLPDWDSPRRIRELSARRMPHPKDLAAIADQLRRAVGPALALPYPDPEAVRLTALADSISPQAHR